MKIARNTVAAIHYTLTNSKGNVLDSSEGSQPLEYLHGAQNIISGLERALEGLGTGDAKKVTVAPADGYGEHDPRLVVAVPRSRFPEEEEILPGMKFHAQVADELRVMTVTSVAENEVFLDGNHELAGEELRFEVEVASVREATAEELSHGHPHREHVCCGGHGHGHCGGHHDHHGK
ncbi:MAG: peptidylprolyl isomerase [Puniceicoccales bacterium]|nr:peptidylprolyl isomerase [Puniceicoccales bacterium]